MTLCEGSNTNKEFIKVSGIVVSGAEYCIRCWRNAKTRSESHNRRILQHGLSI